MAKKSTDNKAKSFDNLDITKIIRKTAPIPKQMPNTAYRICLISTNQGFSDILRIEKRITKAPRDKKTSEIPDFPMKS